MFATTERLIIRAARESDAAQILAMKNDLRVRRTTEINYPVPVGPKGGREYIELSDSRLFFAIIELKPVNEDSAQDNDARWVGVCSLDWASGQKNRDASTDIALRPAHWGKGYGTEIMRWLVDWGFEQIGLHRISLDVFVNNPAAIALYKKLGFQEEGTRKQAIWKEGSWMDFMAMGILEEEWIASREIQ